jgi:hypothetical protein
MQFTSKGFVRYCQMARVAILMVFVGLLLVLGGLYFVGPVLIGTGGSLKGLLKYLLGSLSIWHHTLLFMAALWFLQLAAASMARPENAQRQVAPRLSMAGWLLVLGAAAWAVTRPALLNSAWFASHLVEQNLQYAVWTARHVDNYIAASVIGLVGILLVLVSRVLRDQALATEELRQIF